MKNKVKKIQVKFFKKEKELQSIFNTIDKESLELYAEMMRDRYRENIDDQLCYNTYLSNLISDLQAINKV